MGSVLEWLNSFIDSQWTMAVGEYDKLAKQVLVIVGLILLDITTIDLLIGIPDVLEAWVPSQLVYILESTVVKITTLMAITLLSGVIYCADISHAGVNRWFVALNVFSKVTGKCAIASVVIICCTKVADLVNFLIFNYSWFVYLTILFTAVRAYKFPSNKTEWVTYFFVFVIQSTWLDLLNYCLQYPSVHIHWLILQVINHPPIALPVVYVLQLIWTVGELLYIFACNCIIPLNTLILFFGCIRIALVVHTGLVSPVLQEVEFSWIGLELGFLLIALLLFLAISFCSLEQIPTIAQIQDNSVLQTNVTSLVRNVMSFRAGDIHSPAYWSRVPANGGNNVGSRTAHDTSIIDLNSRLQESISLNIGDEIPEQGDDTSYFKAPQPGFDKCVKCKDRARSAVTLPCQHLCMCAQCAQTEQADHGKCPSCGTPIESVQNLKDDLENVEVTKSQLMCVVCYQNVKSALTLPCRHLHTCGVCAKILCEQGQTCPVCRTPIDLVVFVHDFY